MSEQTGKPSKAAFWCGWILSLIPGLFLLTGSFTAISQSPMVIEGMKPFGYPSGILPVLGAVELVCSVLYLVPRTAVLGALLMTAYFGGAVATHVRIGDPKWVFPVLFGIVTWAGLLLRRPALRRCMLTA